MKTQSQPTEKIWTRNFLLLCLANFFIFAGFQMTLPILPLFLKELGGSDQLIGFLIGSFTISALIIRPWVGGALETKGRKFIYLIGLIIFVLSVGSYVFIVSIYLLFMMRIVQGIGWGMSTTAVGTIATDLIPPTRRGTGMGYFGLSGNIAMAFGPALGLVLIKVIDFPLTFLFSALAGLAAFMIALSIQYKPVEKVEKTRTKSKKLDLYEKTALPPSILLFFNTMIFGGITTFLPLYAVQIGVSGIEWYFTVFAIALMFSRTFAGRIYDKKGHKAVFIPGTVLNIGAMLTLTFLGNVWMLVLAAFLFGTGFGTILPALQAWAVTEAAPNRKGMANATFYSFFDLGIGLGAIFFGFIASTFGYSQIYLTGAISVSISILLYLMMMKKSNREEAV